jgi:hypothetical protein
MITFFTIPKPFTGLNAVHQANAIQSWKQTCRRCEVFAFGDEPGLAEYASTLGVRHFPHIDKSSLGTPLLDQVFLKTTQEARTRYVCYISADVIVLANFQRVLPSICANNFLSIGYRWDLDLNERLDFSSGKWRKVLMKMIEKKGSRHSRYGIDIFLFPRLGGVGPLPPFIVGRVGWDNWMIDQALQKRIPIIDLSP